MLVAVVGGLAWLGCCPTQRAVSASDLRGRLAIDYSVDYPRGAVFELSVPASGRAELVLHQAFDLQSSDPVGRFAATPTPTEREAILAAVHDGQLVGACLGAVASPEGSGRVRLRYDGEQTVHPVGGPTPSEELRRLMGLLDTLARRITASPVAALKLEASFRRDGNHIVPLVTLVHLGDEPLAALIFDQDRPDAGLEMFASLSTNGVERGRSSLADADRARMASTGALPRWPQPIAPGSRFSFELSPLDAPTSGEPMTLRATATLHLPGRGHALAALLLRSEEIPIRTNADD